MNTTTNTNRVAMVRCAKCSLFTLKDIDGSFKGSVEALRQHLADTVTMQGADLGVVSQFAWKAATQQDNQHCACYGHSTLLRGFAERYVARERERQNGKDTNAMKTVYNGKHNEVCGKCNGEKTIESYYYREGGVCFACDGTGKNPWYIGPEPKVETRAKVKTITREEWLAMKSRPVAETVETLVTLDEIKKEESPADDLTYEVAQTKAGPRVRINQNGKFVKWASKAEIIAAGLSF